jgi:hypothetical protein
MESREKVKEDSVEAVKRLFKRPQLDFDRIPEHENEYEVKLALRRDNLKFGRSKKS